MSNPEYDDRYIYDWVTERFVLKAELTENDKPYEIQVTNHCDTIGELYGISKWLRSQRASHAIVFTPNAFRKYAYCIWREVDPDFDYSDYGVSSRYSPFSTSNWAKQWQKIMKPSAPSRDKFVEEYRFDN